MYAVLLADDMEWPVESGLGRVRADGSEGYVQAEWTAADLPYPMIVDALGWAETETGPLMGVRRYPRHYRVEAGSRVVAGAPLEDFVAPNR